MVFGVEMGNYIKPSKEYANIKTPVPMDVPRIRYEFGTRRVGSSPPMANAGANQIGIPAGNVTLNGSGSYDPLGETLTYAWTQISGPQRGALRHQPAGGHLPGGGRPALYVPADGDEYRRPVKLGYHHGHHGFADTGAD